MKNVVTCPECGQAVQIVTRMTIHGPRRVLIEHSPPEWPGHMCPGAHTAPR
jgi:hypothetical protein